MQDTCVILNMLGGFYAPFFVLCVCSYKRIQRTLPNGFSVCKAMIKTRLPPKETLVGVFSHFSFL